MDTFCQIWIILFSAPAIWLVSRKEHWKRWGYIFGLLSQPAWYYTTIEHGQWGMVALVTFYTYAWLQGIYNYWIKKT